MTTDVFASGTQHDTVYLMRRLYREHIRHYLGTMLLAVVFMALTAATTAATAWMFGPVFDWLFTEKNAELLWPLAFVIFLIFSAKAFSAFGHGVLLNRIACRIVAELQDRMFARLMRSDLAEFHASGTGGLISRFTYDVQTLSTAVSTIIIGAGKDSLTVVALVAFMFFKDWQLALIAFVAFPAAAFPMVQYGRKIRGLSSRMQTQIGDMTSNLSQVFQGIRHVKAYNGEQRETEQASKVIWKVAALKQKSARIALAITPIMELLIGLAVVAIILYGGGQVVSGAQPDGTFIVQFIAALLLAYDPMKRLARLNTQLQAGMAAAQRVFDLIDSKPQIVDRPAATVLTPAGGAITLSGVEFSYGPDVPALHGVDIDVPAGSTVALVGPSGAGKSTVLNLIPRFYDVGKGTVAVDGHDVRDVTMKSLRDQLALVSQEIILFDQTVRENIAFARPDASEDDIVKAAEAAAAHDFISRLPEGYGTIVGEHGVKLSGGQRQRISIARAMLKNAPILLLDEATSALDTESEKQVQDALKRLMVGRTTLMIAHRLSTVAEADLIYVLEDGQVVERGTHTELIGRRGLYARLWSMQTAAPDDGAIVATAGG